MIKKTLADLKRDIVPGTKIAQVERYEARPLPGQSGNTSNFEYGPLVPVAIPEKLQGTRTVTYKDTTGFYMNATPEDGKRGSYLNYPKASELDYTADGFTVTSYTAMGHPWLKMVYKIID
jgi:Flp pilus assembly secretin CpaC